MKFLRLLAPVAALVLAGSLIACSDDDGDASWLYTRHDVTVSMTGMSPHVGQHLALRIVHVETGTEVARAHVESISATSFDVWIPEAVVAGEIYHVDFYVDFNMNGRYDAPPADHAWRRVLQPSGPVALDFEHDANFTDIDFPPHD